MLLKGNGYFEENGRLTYNTKSYLIYPDSEVCKELAEKCNLPSDCINRIGVFSEKAKLSDVSFVFKMMLSIFEENNLEVKDVKTSETCHLGKVVFKNRELNFGVQLKDKKLYAMMQGRCDFKTEQIPEIIYGEVVIKQQLSPYTEPVCIYDLQCGNDFCYYASEGKTMNGNRVILLRGNGWKDEQGFPYEDRRYPGIIGKTAANLRAELSKECIPDFKDIYSGDIRDLIELEYITKENES